MNNQYGDIVNACLAAITKLSSDFMGSIVGIAINVSAMVNKQSNKIIYSSSFDLNTGNLYNDLKSATSYPIYLWNRARTAAYAELDSGGAVNFKHFNFISLGLSIGSVIISNGQIIEGQNNLAGEIRTLPVHDEQGNIVNIEELINPSVLLNSAQANGSAATTPKQLYEDYCAQESSAMKTINYMGEQLAQALKILSSITDPEAFVLGGRFKDLGPKFIAQLKQQFLSHSGDIDIILSNYGSSGGCIGGGSLVIENFIQQLGEE